MNFNPDPTKHTHEVIFSRKAKEINHPLLVFNNTSFSQPLSQKYLGVILGSKLIFDAHLKLVSLKISKTLDLLRKLNNLLPRSALITIDKYIKLLSDPALIMVIFVIIKNIICPFTINSNLFSIMPTWP